MTEQINTPSLTLTWSQAPWDEVVCGFPVMQVTSIQVKGPNTCDGMQLFERARDKLGAGFVSCRLPHDSLKESMLLEEFGFRFIEMMYSPGLNLGGFESSSKVNLLPVRLATEADLPVLLNIASTAFQNERFKMDPRLDPSISDRRFENWVSSSLVHTTQRIHVICDKDQIIAFFVTEMKNDGTCYWHLNAVAPNAQGRGYGRIVWLSMINQAVLSSADRISTSIAARNHRVLNLYARLGFIFPPPSMTFHWVRQ